MVWKGVPEAKTNYSANYDDGPREFLAEPKTAACQDTVRTLATRLQALTSAGRGEKDLFRRTAELESSHKTALLKLKEKKMVHPLWAAVQKAIYS